MKLYSTEKVTTEDELYFSLSGEYTEVDGVLRFSFLQKPSHFDILAVLKTIYLWSVSSIFSQNVLRLVFLHDLTVTATPGQSSVALYRSASPEKKRLRVILWNFSGEKKNLLKNEKKSLQVHFSSFKKGNKKKPLSNQTMEPRLNARQVLEPFLCPFNPPLLHVENLTLISNIASLKQDICSAVWQQISFKSCR